MEEKKGVCIEEKKGRECVCCHGSDIVIVLKKRRECVCIEEKKGMECVCCHGSVFVIVWMGTSIIRRNTYE